jgi:hypothetical protein
MGCQLGKVSWLPPALPQGLTSEPGDDPDHIHGCRRQELLEVRARQPQIPTPAEIKASYSLREATLNTRPQGILRGELRRLLALPRGLERLVVGLQPDRELAWGAFRCGTRLAGGARTTRGPVEPDADDRVARDITRRPPIDAGMPLGTARLLGVPIDDREYCLSNYILVCFPIMLVVTRAIGGGKHGRLSEMHTSARGQGREGQGQTALVMSGLWLSVYVHHAAWATTVAKVASGLSLLPRRLDERAGQDVRRPRQFDPEVDPSLCDGV